MQQFKLKLHSLNVRSGIMDWPSIDLVHEIAQEVEDQLYSQYHDNFSPSNIIIFKILALFCQKIAKNEKLRFSAILQKIGFTE